MTCAALYVVTILVALTYVVMLQFEPANCPGDRLDSEVPPDCDDWASMIIPFFIGTLVFVPLAALAVVVQGAIAVARRRARPTPL